MCQSQYTQLFIFNDCQTFSESLLNHSDQELKAGKIWAVCPVCIPRWYNQPSTDDTGQITVKGQEVRYQPHTLSLIKNKDDLLLAKAQIDKLCS